MAVERCTVLRKLDVRSLQEHLDLTRALENGAHQDDVTLEAPPEETFQMRGLYELIPGADFGPLPIRLRG